MINRVTLLGHVSDYGPKIRWLPSGAAECTFTLIVTAPGKDGTPYKTFIPVMILGAKAEHCAETLEPGMLTAIDGKLSWRKSEAKKSGEKADGKLVVMAWGATPVVPAGIEQPALLTEDT